MAGLVPAIYHDAELGLQNSNGGLHEWRDKIFQRCCLLDRVDGRDNKLGHDGAVLIRRP